MAVLPREKNDRRQAGDDAALQDQYRGSHQPIQGHHARRAVLAGLAPLGARQALEHPALGVLAPLTLPARNYFPYRARNYFPSGDFFAGGMQNETAILPKLKLTLQAERRRGSFFTLFF